MAVSELKLIDPLCGVLGVVVVKGVTKVLVAVPVAEESVVVELFEVSRLVLLLEDVQVLVVATCWTTLDACCSSKKPKVY